MAEQPELRGELVVVTGMTGAGRSTAAKELEDLGFFVVDNLPPRLVPDVVRLIDESQGALQPVGVVVDVRSGSFFASLQEVLAQGKTGRRTTLLFLEANDDVLVRRQEAARRPHPLQEGGRLLDGLHRERVVLASLRGDADYVKDRPEAKEFLEQYVALIDTVAQGYAREGKRFMTVAIGCTGGRHRSVAMTEEIAGRLRAMGMDARPRHRDLGRE